MTLVPELQAILDKAARFPPLETISIDVALLHRSVRWTQ